MIEWQDSSHYLVMESASPELTLQDAKPFIIKVLKKKTPILNICISRKKSLKFSLNVYSILFSICIWGKITWCLKICQSLFFIIIYFYTLYFSYFSFAWTNLNLLIQIMSHKNIRNKGWNPKAKPYLVNTDFST